MQDLKTGFLEPQALATRSLLGPRSPGVGLRGNHLSVAPVARGTVRVPGVISLFEALDFAISTTMRSDWNELPPF